MKTKGIRVTTIFMTLLILGSICLPTVSAKENTAFSSIDAENEVIIENRPDIQIIEMTDTSSIVQVGDIVISLNTDEDFTEGIMEVEDVTTNEKEVLEFYVTKLSDNFKVDVTLNEENTESYFTTYNPLDPGETKELLSQKTTPSLFQDEQVVTRSTSYVWDDVNFVKGTGVKYPHPSYTAYNGEVWQDYYINGDELKHNHIRQSRSNTISQLAPAVAGATIGAYLGNVPGAAIGAALGLVLGGTSSDALLDEEGCIWYWESHISSYVSLPPTNLPIFVPLYYRIASYTLWDTMSVGNP
ncbi:hypothetical protein [Methanococcoides sp. LMO-2]|uniref:Glycine zipper domain-containing protein n=1 Tax=Methanococcoides cohabitans TaxID=3136559 RepID=A0ABU9KUM9_9EURY